MCQTEWAQGCSDTCTWFSRTHTLNQTITSPHCWLAPHWVAFCVKPILHVYCYFSTAMYALPPEEIYSFCVYLCFRVIFTILSFFFPPGWVRCGFVCQSHHRNLKNMPAQTSAGLPWMEAISFMLNGPGEDADISVSHCCCPSERHHYLHAEWSGMLWDWIGTNLELFSTLSNGINLLGPFTTRGGTNVPGRAAYMYK